MVHELSPQRRNLLEQVRRLSLSPWEAERWAEQHNLEPFAKRPSVPDFDPMAEPQWTLPMAAAWFLWRSIDAVRDHSDEYRRSWTVWRRIPRSRKTDDFTCELQAIGDASLREIFASPDMLRFPQKWPWDVESPRKRIPTPTGSLDCSPRKRLSRALATESLIATGVAAGRSGDRTSVPAEFVRAYYRYLARGASLSDDDKLNLKFVVSKKDFRLRYNRVLFDRSAVMAADEAASRQDFADEEWLVEHVLGWIAYRDRNRLRLLARSAPAAPSFARVTYPLDFSHHDPGAELVSALVGGRLVARPSTEILKLGILDPVPQSWWCDRQLTEAPDLWFQKADVLRLWPPDEANGAAQVRGLNYQPAPTDAIDRTPRLQRKVLRIVAELWPNRELPPRNDLRDQAIIDEFMRKGWGPVSSKTIDRALKKDWS